MFRLLISRSRSARYNSVYSTAAEEIRQSGLWDGYAQRNSTSYEGLPPPGPGGAYGHGRGLSKSSGLRNEVGRQDDPNEYMESREYLEEYGMKNGADPEKAGGDTYVSGYRDDVHDEYGQPPSSYHQGGGYEGGFRPPVVDSRDYDGHYEHQQSYGQRPPSQPHYYAQQDQRRY